MCTLPVLFSLLLSYVRFGVYLRLWTAVHVLEFEFHAGALCDCIWSDEGRRVT